MAWQNTACSGSKSNFLFFSLLFSCLRDFGSSQQCVVPCSRVAGRELLGYFSFLGLFTFCPFADSEPYSLKES